VNLGPHPPRLWPEDVDRTHDIWLDLTENEGMGAALHHRDVVNIALRRLERDLEGGERAGIVEQMRREINKA
jgi:hypothetical protein